MLNQSISPRVTPPTTVASAFPPASSSQGLPSPSLAKQADDNAITPLLDGAPMEWSEEGVVFLHWCLLEEVNQLADPTAPLDEKFDILRWVFTEPEKDAKPFSFVSCLRVVGCSPLSPVAYCGLVDTEAIRDYIRNSLWAWFRAALERYPEWVRDVFIRNPLWIESRLAKNPQWINEQIKRMAVTGDLFN
ncbi:hypothetical protein PTW32_01010 [Dechloromonas agitata]|uniref:hypothetical protein n=1 Tax=Dechloromonas agitata TaxID=73030 RepID=UPI00237DD1DD|nr:hypothetical protein [Dechloromonas agitata]MDE1543980.1 hypothetical protein [Dechloromonas agitata]